MANEIKLDSETIQSHYESLLAGAEDCDDPNQVENDDTTNITIRTNMLLAYGGALLAQNDISVCLAADAEHLKKLNATFISVDDNISSDINDLLSY